MKMRVLMVWGVLLAILLAAEAKPVRAETTKKITVAVENFGDQSGRGLGNAATDDVTQNFFQLKYFTVVERSRLDQVTNEAVQQNQGKMIDERLGCEPGPAARRPANCDGQCYQRWL